VMSVAATLRQRCFANSTHSFGPCRSSWRRPSCPHARSLSYGRLKNTRQESLFSPDRRAANFSPTWQKMVLLRMKIKGATFHGFGSSFRDWAGNVSNFPREITELPSPTS